MSLSEFQEQLSQVLEALQDDPDDADLIAMKLELEEMITSLATCSSSSSAVDVSNDPTTTTNISLNDNSLINNLNNNNNLDNNNNNNLNNNNNNNNNNDNNKDDTNNNENKTLAKVQTNVSHVEPKSEPLNDASSSSGRTESKRTRDDESRKPRKPRVTEESKQANWQNFLTKSKRRRQ